MGKSGSLQLSLAKLCAMGIEIFSEKSSEDRSVKAPSQILYGQCPIGLLLADVLMYFNFVPLGFFQLQSIDYLWIERKTLVNRSLYEEFIKGTSRVENITL